MLLILSMVLTVSANMNGCVMLLSLSVFSLEEKAFFARSFLSRVPSLLTISLPKAALRQLKHTLPFSRIFLAVKSASII